MNVITLTNACCKYQQIYDFGNAPQGQEEEDSNSNGYSQQNNHNQYTSPLAGTFTFRYPQFHSFPQEQQILTNTSTNPNDFTEFNQVRLTPCIKCNLTCAF